MVTDQISNEQRSDQSMHFYWKSIASANSIWRLLKWSTMHNSCVARRQRWSRDRSMWKANHRNPEWCGCWNNGREVEGHAAAVDTKRLQLCERTRARRCAFAKSKKAKLRLARRKRVFFSPRPHRRQPRFNVARKWHDALPRSCTRVQVHSRLISGEFYTF